MNRREAFFLLSHFLTKWGDKSWDFVIPLVFVEIFPDLLFPAAFFGFTMQFSIFLLGPSVGRWMDHVNRAPPSWFPAASGSLPPKFMVVVLGVVVQNASVFINGVLLLSLLMANAASLRVALVALVALVGVPGELGALASSVSVERDWVPAYFMGGDLPTLNSRLTRIDLACEVAAPIFAGLCLSLLGVSAGFLVVVALNILSMAPELLLLFAVMRLSEASEPPPEGAEERLDPEGVVPGDPEPAVLTVMADGDTDRAVLPGPEGERDGRQEAEEGIVLGGLGINPIRLLRSQFEGIGAFSRHPVALVVVSYALLWLTALSPHGILLTAYLKAYLRSVRGNDVWISLFRGAGALVGVLATFLYQPVARRFGIFWACTVFLAWLALSIALCLVSFYVGDLDDVEDFSTGVLGLSGLIGFLSMMVLARVGLYAFCIGEAEILQVGVEPELRGTIGSIERAVCSLGTLTILFLGMVAYRPEYFVYLVWVSALAVALGALLFMGWTLQHDERNFQQQQTKKQQQLQQ